MEKIASIGSHLKKIYRIYSSDLIKDLIEKGFNDLRPSFLDILMFLAENEGASIKLIGKSCGLKKQTMTSHLNELEKRGYIRRNIGEQDKREQNIYLTEYGEKFRFSLYEVTQKLEKKYIDKFGATEIERIQVILETFYSKLTYEESEQPTLI